MRDLFRIIFSIPRLIINIIWNFFWTIFRTIMIIGIVCFGLPYYANNNSSQLANTVSTIANNVTSYFSANSDDIVNSLEDLSVDDFTYHSGTRWSNNSVNAYIEMTNETSTEAYGEAIGAWNATGTFILDLVSNESSADIIATDYSNASSKAAGLAKTETNALTNRITHVDVKLNTYYSAEDGYGYTHNHIAYTTEHELGHAIELDHDDGEQSAMQSLGSYYDIQDVDIQRA